MKQKRRAKVAIVGGGCAGIAAAFELSRPELNSLFEVTVYQQGWRLGGKGASGRGVDGRIEEHGLHLWMGYYENAFRLLRECYDELHEIRPGSWGWRDAFHPVTKVGVEEAGPGGWQSWLAYFPMNEKTPGDPKENWKASSIADYMLHGMQLATALLRSVSNKAPVSSHPMEQDPSDPYEWLRLAGGLVAELVPYAEAVAVVSLHEGVAMLNQLVGRGSPAEVAGPAGDLLGSLQRALARRIQALAEQDSGKRRTLEVAEIVLANLTGTLRFGLLSDPRGFDAVDEYEYRDWLKLNGASDLALNSALVRGLYNLAFAYEGGDQGRPRLSAGQALRAANRAFFTYKGALFWKMNAGMGDVVFAPFYEVLSSRGVNFEFFHRLERLQISRPDEADDGPYVAALHFDVQASTIEGRSYRPLVDVGGLPSWPAEPDYAQLIEGPEGRTNAVDLESFWSTRRTSSKTLLATRDFDFVVLAVGLGAVPHVCSELLDSDPRWREMVEHVKTTATRAFQIWLKPSLEELGWPYGSYDVSGFAEPFDTWADMSHLASAEQHVEKPGTIAYFCSVLPEDRPLPSRGESDYLRERTSQVQEDVFRFLNEHASDFWPNAVDEHGQFRWELLHMPQSLGPGKDDAPPFYWRANVNPSDRYTLSVPGSARFRISPLDNTYDNLTIAGDWTDGYNIGCVEAAFMSGRLAAHAISERPALEEIVGFDHP